MHLVVDAIFFPKIHFGGGNYGPPLQAKATTLSGGGGGIDRDSVLKYAKNM